MRRLLRILSRRAGGHGLLATVALSTSVVACGSPALSAAEQGNLAKLQTEIAREHAQGKLSNGRAADLARAVAVREIATAKDEATALARLRDARACAGELDDALAQRMKTRDGAGAEAALSRLEDGNLSDGAARAWLDDADDRWRAVSARTLHRESDRTRRQAAMLDPSARVRRAAIRAAAAANDASDLDILFETARVDPELLLRNEALRSMSAILRGVGDAARPKAADLAVRLRDLWTVGDDALKEDIAVAWGLRPVFEHGGREALRVVISTEKGPGAIAAAGVVLRNASKDAELVSSAHALLARTILDSSRRDRLHALAVARAQAPVLDAVRKAAADDDGEVKVAALARLVDEKPHRDAAIKELFEIAGYGVSGAADDERAFANAIRARHVLASSGQLRVQAWIEKDLASPESRRKTSAAFA
ncbi:MAG TPA: hypothetical protein VM580_05185, partial [Labilithrix sp.]|nr:hypothetical protein [Labilithrix sp.]